MKNLFLQIATAPDDLLREDERSCCADAIVKQIMEQGHDQEREAILAQRTENRDRGAYSETARQCATQEEAHRAVGEIEEDQAKEKASSSLSFSAVHLPNSPQPQSLSLIHI